MTETHELNRLVICLLYPARGMTRRVKILRTAFDDRFHWQAPLTLCVCAGALRLSTGIASDSFFESDTTVSEAVGSVVYGRI